MSEPFIGNIMMFGGSFAPLGWAFCDGSLLPIAQYDALFALIGTTYGGDGQNTFGLPDLRGRIPIHQGQGPGLSNYVIGQVAGAETITLTGQQMPVHTHAVLSNAATGNSDDPTNNFLGAQPELLEYISGGSANATMKSNAVSNSTGGQSHNNIMPVLVLNYVIALEGIFPSQN
jgi:microcystin-dependent protein